jgi:phosphoserine aminotransferase
LGVPDDFLVAIVPASDTGAVEMAMWSMLGARGLTVLAWENFSNDWAIDAAEQLKLPNTRIMTADYGKLPDLASVDFDTDVVFAWNGTTSGARVPMGIGSPPIAQASPFVMPPRRLSPWSCHGTSSMSPPILGKKC